MKTPSPKIALTLFVMLFPILPGAGFTLAQDDEKQAQPATPKPKSMEIQLVPEGPGARSPGELRIKQQMQSRRMAIPAPDDVAAIPEDAETTESGVAFRILKSGEGDSHPGPNDHVTLRYTGWQADGLMFDSTELKKKSRSFGVNKVIPGFSEGLQLMVAGEKRRLWVPEELAYAGKPNKPQGMLVFDVELLSFIRAPETPPDLAEPPQDAVRTESGLAYKIVREGDGDLPGPEDMLLLELNAWTPEGSLYDSSALKGKPFNFRMDMTIPAFAELLPGMSRGAKWMIWSPEELARLDDDSIVEGDLVFEVELIDFVSRPETPIDVIAPPAEAERSVTGLATKVLQPGTGDRHPRTGERVEVEYAGWTRDGEIFDSSFDHGRPGVFTLGDHMPRGWNEALKMMVVGEKRRMWIPEELAYGGQKDRPEGMLIFDVELLSIKEPEPEPEPEPETEDSAEPNS